jgi:hypothetical protein
VVLEVPLKNEVIIMIKFQRYTVEQLKHWIWGFENLKPLRSIFTTEDYKRAVEELNKRRMNYDS